jgi:hypothetical protein
MMPQFFSPEHHVLEIYLSLCCHLDLPFLSPLPINKADNFPSFHQNLLTLACSFRPFCVLARCSFFYCWHLEANYWKYNAITQSG